MPDSISDSVTLSFGREELTLRDRYESASIVNDIVIALWFIVGSVLFFSESTSTLGTWFFLLGSIQMAIRPGIRLARRVHLRRLSPGHPCDSGFDH